jgi:tetratricopeptide (TPR) repeat protein
MKACILRHIWPLAVLVLAACAVFGQLLGHGFMYNWDDEYYVLRNEAIQGITWEHLRAAFSQYYVGNYAPVQIISYMLDYTLWGYWPGGYYLTNLLLHSGNALLFYLLMYHWYRDRLIAFCAAAFFLLHPVQVESVAWISQRKTLLAMFFFLLAWHGYCRHREAGEGAGRAAYVFTVVAYLLSLLAKPVAVMFPVVLFLYDRWFVHHQRSRAGLQTLVPFVLASGAITTVSLFSQQPVDSGWMGQGGGVVPYHGGSPLATFYTMLPVFCRYLGMLFWPVDLSLLYFPVIHRVPDVQVLAAAFLLSLLAWGGVKLFRMDRRFGFWVLVFWLGLAPVSQIVPLATLMNDRYLYFPLLGAAALFACGMAALRDRLNRVRPNWWYLPVVLPLVLAGSVSFLRVAVWRDPVVAWRDTVAHSPHAERAVEKLAEAYQFATPPQYQEALDGYRRVTAMNPAASNAWYQLGNIYRTLGDYVASIEALQTFLMLKPDHVMGIAALGYSYQMSGRHREAETEYSRALTLQPDATPVVSMLGSLELARGNLDPARAAYLRVDATWQDPESAFQLAVIEALDSRREQALVWLEKALQRGYADRQRVLAARELDSIRDDVRFNVLLDRYGVRSGQK